MDVNSVKKEIMEKLGDERNSIGESNPSNIKGGDS